MRTKALLLTAALGAAGIATSMAQVYSINAVGYVNVSVPVNLASTDPTFIICGNPLNGTNNLLNTIIPAVPDNTTIYLFRGSFESYFFVNGVGWLGGEAVTVDPGEGFFLSFDPTTASNPTVVTFVGEVPQGNLQNSLPTGFSLRSSQVPQAGGISSLLRLTGGHDNDEVYQFDPVMQAYGSAFFVSDPMDPNGGIWIPTEPVIAVAEGFWFNNTGATVNWNRTFSVN